MSIKKNKSDFKIDQGTTEEDAKACSLQTSKSNRQSNDGIRRNQIWYKRDLFFIKILLVALVNPPIMAIGSQSVDLHSKSASEVQNENPIPSSSSLDDITSHNELRNVGFVGSYLNNYMKTVFTAGTPANPKSVEADMRGDGFGISGFYGTQLSELLWVNLLLGFDSYHVSTKLSEAYCAAQTSQTCYVKVNFFTAHSILKYIFSQTPRSRWWVGGGLGFLFAISKYSTVLDAEKIDRNGIYSASMGADYFLNSGKNFIPIEMSIALFPSSSETSARMLIVKAGYGWQY